MRIFKTTANNNDYVFVCNHANTRNGFKHTCELFVNESYAADNVCHYLNRTWEKYNYQSVMFGCVRNLIEERKAVLQERYKNDNGYVKMTAKRKAEFEVIVNNDNKIAELLEVQNTIDEGF